MNDSIRVLYFIGFFMTAIFVILIISINGLEEIDLTEYSCQDIEKAMGENSCLGDKKNVLGYNTNTCHQPEPVFNSYLVRCQGVDK